jgi:hypothetical protein
MYYTIFLKEIEDIYYSGFKDSAEKVIQMYGYEKENRHTKIPYRLTISLDEKSLKILKDISFKENEKNLSQVVRKAIYMYYTIKIDLNFQRDIEWLRNWVNALSTGEHLIIDVEHWSTFFELLFNNISKEDLLQKVRESGLSHGVQYAKRGINTIEEIVRTIERANWYEIKKEDEDTFVLILKEPRSCEFVKTFLEGIFESQNKNINIIKGSGKLIVIEE